MLKELLELNNIIQIPFETRLKYVTDLFEDIDKATGWMWISKQLDKDYSFRIYSTKYEDIFYIRVDTETCSSGTLESCNDSCLLAYCVKGTYEDAHAFLGKFWIPSHFTDKLMLFFDKKTGCSFVGSVFKKDSIAGWIYSMNIIKYPANNEVLTPIYDNGLYLGYMHENGNIHWR